MLTSRKALISNLNYVHMQHVSLGVHLSMRSEVMEDPMGQDTGLKDVSTHQHQYKDISETLLVDANSNDPSVPCQCCDQHSSHAETIKYSSNENLETIMCEDYLSPDDLPLSPLSPSSPSTDSSSSSDFTLDDSPVSMYYKEYAQDDLETPDQQPDIIPLDVERGSSPPSSLDDSIDSSHPITERRGDVPENTINNNMLPEDVPFIDWSSDSVVDSNSNSLLDALQPDLPSLCSTSMDVDDVVDPKPQMNVLEKEDIANANQTNVHRWSLDEDLLVSLSVSDEPSTQTPKKTITSFHELAQRRRKSGGPPQPKKDKSDWLIVFSPDVEQPPVNELTASAFYHGLVMPQAQPLPEGKEVTTFRELRYRNSVNKQISQHVKPPLAVVKGSQDSGATDAADANTITEVSNGRYDFTDEKNYQDCTRESDGRERWPQEGANGPARGSQKADMKLPDLDTPEAPHRLWARNDHRAGMRVDLLPAMTLRMGKHCSPVSFNNAYSRKEEVPTKEEEGEQRRGMADGGDRRGLEGDEPLMAEGGGVFSQCDKKSLLVTIGSSVDRIISHFNGSRNQVQKTQLGDSRLSPKLGYLIVNHLCPSLFSLLGDGLKAFQKDVLIGRRRLSPWNLVEASAKSGLESFHILFHNVSRFQQLRDPQRRFNAFILGLLNTKQLDVWISHLHQISDRLSVFFLPSGFLPLAATSRPELREELLLILQPLSALTFHTDLLFEHHHLPLQDPPTPHNPSNQTPAEGWGAPPLRHILDLGSWLAQNLTGNTEREKPKEGRSSGVPPPNVPSRACAKGPVHPACGSSPGAAPKTKDPNNTWWGQLSHASRLYIPPNKDSFRKLRGTSDKERNQAEQISSRQQRWTSDKEQNQAERISSREQRWTSDKEQNQAERISSREQRRTSDKEQNQAEQFSSRQQRRTSDTEQNQAEQISSHEERRTSDKEQNQAEQFSSHEERRTSDKEQNQAERISSREQRRTSDKEQNQEEQFSSREQRRMSNKEQNQAERISSCEQRRTSDKEEDQAEQFSSREQRWTSDKEQNQAEQFSSRQQRWTSDKEQNQAEQFSSREQRRTSDKEQNQAERISSREQRRTSDKEQNQAERISSREQRQTSDKEQNQAERIFSREQRWTLDTEQNQAEQFSSREQRWTSDKEQNQAEQFSSREQGRTSDKEQNQAEQISSREQRLPGNPDCEGDPEKTGNGTEMQRRPNRSVRDPTPRRGGGAPCRQPVRVNGGPTPEEKGTWFGPLFGATSTPSRDLEARTVKSRRPSSWLPPHVNVLHLIGLRRSPEREGVLPAESEERSPSDCKPERSLRALCDLAASGEAQLSFRKGDVLQLLGTVDEDWIRCKRGSDTGLVPVGYTSLIL